MTNPINIKYRSHRGGVYYTPENTMPAFEAALKEGFAYIETDPCFTKDGIIVLHHDGTINRTCRNPDGSVIKDSIPISSLTYEELLEYDAGIAMGDKFKGTKVPTLEMLLKKAENTDVIIALDKKIQTHEIQPLLELTAKFNTKVCFSCKDVERIKRIQEVLPDAMIDYDGNTTEEELRAVTSLVKRENLLVWLYMDKPNFAWLTDRFKASKENCMRVKRYARLGIANICTPYDVKEALEFNPDVIEI